MPKFAIGLCFFQDRASLERCLPTLKDFDHVFAIDGRFDYARAPNELSTDGSRELIQSFPNTILIDRPNTSEQQKRQTYCELCKEYGCDYLLTVDADEYVKGNISYFKKDCIEHVDPRFNVYATLVQDEEKPSYYIMRPRLWFHPWEMQYLNMHYAFRRKDSNAKESWLKTGSPADIMWGIWINHDHKLRSVEYTGRQAEFYKIQHPPERALDILTLKTEDQLRAEIAAELGWKSK